MNPNNFTIKTQEVLADAQQIAFDLKHAYMDTFHLMKAILNNDEDMTPFLFKKTGVDIKKIEQELSALIQKQPTVSEDNVKYPSQNLSQVLLKANSYLKELNDEYVSIEHLLLA